MRTQSHRTVAWVTHAAILVFALCLMVVSVSGCGLLSRETSESSEPAMSPVDDAMLGEGTFAEEEMIVEAPASQDLARTGAGQDVSDLPVEERLIIRSKSLRMEVEDVRGTIDDVRNLAKTHEAIVTNVNVSTDSGPIYRYDEYGQAQGSGAALSGWITVRVPAESYEDFIDAVDGLGEILWEGETTDDVTQQHVDLSARLENLQAEEARLREFFDAAENVEEMLQIERELVRVRGDIESLSAQVAYLERQAAMATVTIELSEQKPLVRPDGPDWGFGEALTEGLQLAADVVRVAIVVLLGALPLLALAALAFLIVRALVRSRRKGRSAGGEDSA